jgi:hypothetical protein
LVVCALLVSALLPALTGCSVDGPHGSHIAGTVDRDVSTAADPTWPLAVQRQFNYARDHWNHYNLAAYGDLNEIGGDCANFVNQTLVARGWRMNSQWQSHDAGKDRSLSWGYAPAMDEYLAENAAALHLTQYPFDQRSQISVGDIVMFAWNGGSIDHVMVVTHVEKPASNASGRVQLYLTGHNYDEFNESLDIILAKYPHATGHIWHIAS